MQTIEQLNEAWESYFYPGTNVLKNKLNIMDYDELAEKEAEISFEKLIELQENPIKGNFDKEHLFAIHRFIFGDLYEWAGKTRIVDMQKKSMFLSYERIDEFLDIELGMMNDEIGKVSSKNSLASFLARYFAELINIHPFREAYGNRYVFYL